MRGDPGTGRMTQEGQRWRSGQDPAPRGVLGRSLQMENRGIWLPRRMPSRDQNGQGRNQYLQGRLEHGAWETREEKIWGDLEAVVPQGSSPCASGAKAQSIPGQG